MSFSAHTYKLIQYALAACVLPLAGCGPQPLWMFGEPSLYPTAIDSRRSDGAFLVGGYHSGFLLTVYSTGRILRDQPRLLPAADRPRRVLRLKIDEKRQRLWLLDNGFLWVYSLENYRLLRKITLAETILTKATCLPDIALTAAGDVFVSDVGFPVLFRIDGRTLELSILGITNIESTGFSALAPLDNPAGLLAAHAASGRTWFIDTATGRATALTPDRSVLGICGMSADPSHAKAHHDSELVAIHVTTGMHHSVGTLWVPIAKILRGEAVAAGQLTAVFHHRTRTPVSIVGTPDRLYVASSQLSEHRDFNDGHHSPPDTPFRINVIPKPLPARGP